MSQKNKIKIVLKSNGKTLNINNNLEANKKKELKMSQRFLEIKNFKNIGITKEEDQWERLYLNNSLDKDKIGELIILIGENNVGKSNILDAINTIIRARESTIFLNFKNCLPDFRGYNDCLPKLKLVYKDDENNSYDLEVIIDEYGKVKLIDNIANKGVIKEKYDIDFIPNIFFYIDYYHIEDKELITTPKKIKDSKFFNSLFKAINYRTSIITTAYEKDKKTRGHKDQYQDTINKKLEEIVNKKFNELYFQDLGTQKYNFSIKLEKDEIYLSIEKNGDIIALSQQSVGFKWFFNFFFNFLYTNELKAGDIVLMDEPGIHLSIPGRRDLRKFIKKFAKDTGITFIATTHNPSFVDIDYLDELRIIKNNKDGIGVKIQSNFSALADDEVDTLDSIINSFGILRIDLTREYKIIFVEGITDYNYLTAFKLLYNQNKKEEEKLNIAFIPINGLGKDDNEMRYKLTKLIQFKDAILLTDGDTRGNTFKNLCSEEKLKDRLTAIPLTEIDALFKNIENLFSQNDKEKFKDMIENKGIKESSSFKNSIAQLELDAKTIENFNKVLKYLNEMS